MLAWSTRKMAKWVEEALKDAPSGMVAVLGDAALGKAVAATGRKVVGSVAPDSALAAVVSVSPAASAEAYEGWSQAVVDGGVVVVIERAAREEASCRALSAALSELSQRVSGKRVMTSGRVRRF